MRTGIVTFVTALVVLAFGPAAAGGGNWIEFDEKYNVSGSKVTVNATMYATERAREAGPLYVYLKHVDSWSAGWSLPDVTDPEVHRLGPLTTDWSRINRRYYDVTVSGTVELPKLERGRYLMSICDLDCTFNTGIDVTGDFWIVSTPEVAALRTRLDRVKTNFMTYRYREEAQDRKAYNEFVGDLNEQGRRETRKRMQLRHAIAGVETDLASMRSELDETRSERALALAAMALVLVAATYAFGRSRSRARALLLARTPASDSDTHPPTAASRSLSSAPHWRRASLPAIRRVGRATRPSGSSPRTSEQPGVRSRE